MTAARNRDIRKIPGDDTQIVFTKAHIYAILLFKVTIAGKAVDKPHGSFSVRYLYGVTVHRSDDRSRIMLKIRA